MSKPNKSQNKESFTSYGRPIMDGNKKARGSGFSFDSMQQDTTQQRKPKEREKRLVTHQAWLFKPGEKDPFIHGVPLTAKEGSENLFFKINYTTFNEGKRGKESEEKDITAYLRRRNPMYNGNSLTSIDLEATTKNGLIIFLDLPGSGGIRIYRNNGVMSLHDYRVEVCYAEAKFDEESLRKEYKDHLPKGFLYPGPEGNRLAQNGVEVLFPVFKSGEDRKSKIPHQHIIRADAGSSFEIMFEYQHKAGIPNWYQVDIDKDGAPSAYNIRAEGGDYMIEARKRLASEDEARRDRIEAQNNEL